MSDLEGFGFVLPHWAYWGWLAIMPLIMIYLDKRGLAKGQPNEDHPDLAQEHVAEEDPVIHHPMKGNKFTRAIDWVCQNSGVFIAFWTVNAVIFYFFEVVMRYIFNMPTIWVHEASFLLLGMQYLLAGAFALLHGAHVRVDIVYNLLPERGRVGMDIFTSIFFFIFALALCWTSWTFFQDSYSMNERTVETWGIQYWPVKFAMFFGAFMILMAGLSKLIKDIMLFNKMGRDQAEVEAREGGAA